MQIIISEPEVSSGAMARERGCAVKPGFDLEAIQDHVDLRYMYTGLLLT